MSREEQKRIRELEKSLTKSCKEIGKRRGWKTIAGHQYQVRDSILYILYVRLSVFDAKIVKADLRCKPVVLDDIYWEVFHMKEEADQQPFSFHVQGAFTARGLMLEPWTEHLPSPEALLPTLEAVFDQAEVMVEQNRFPDIAAFRRRLEESSPHSALSIILCLLCEGEYQRAMEQIEAALARGDNGNFSRENGRRSIMEDAQDWCAARLDQI